MEVTRAAGSAPGPRSPTGPGQQRSRPACCGGPGSAAEPSPPAAPGVVTSAPEGFLRGCQAAAPFSGCVRVSCLRMEFWGVGLGRGEVLFARGVAEPGQPGVCGAPGAARESPSPGSRWARIVARVGSLCWGLRSGGGWGRIC